MNKNDVLEKFGKTYINFVRDKVINGMNQIILGEYKGYSGQILQKKIESTQNNTEILKDVITATVDKCLHYTLFMLEEYQDEMRLVVKDQDNAEHSLVDISDGLCGELYTEDGWIEKYTKYPDWKQEIE